MDAICSHEHYYLDEGEVDVEEHTIECAKHGSTFDLETGNPRTLPAMQPVAVYAVKIDGDDILIEVTDERSTETAPATLEVRGLHADVEGKQILNGIDLIVTQGETHALMGPNGSGKSTLSQRDHGPARIRGDGRPGRLQGRGHHRASRRTSARSGASSSRCSTRPRCRASRS